MLDVKLSYLSWVWENKLNEEMNLVPALKKTTQNKARNSVLYASGRKINKMKSPGTSVGKKKIIWIFLCQI